jgi:hypothetical protein
MRSVLLGIITAAGLVLASTPPTLSAPVNASTISQAVAELNPIAQARCGARCGLPGAAVGGGIVGEGQPTTKTPLRQRTRASS